MPAVSIAAARDFVANVDLPQPRARPFELAGHQAGALLDQSLDKAKDQAMIVGSDVVSFVKGVTPGKRGDIGRSSLLAQLVAKKQVPDTADIYSWYNAYFEALEHIGWVVQNRTFAEYRETRESFETHQAILKVAATLLGPATTALAVVTATMESLQSMSADSPWITIFNRESKSAKTAHFQVMLVEQGDGDSYLCL